MRRLSRLLLAFLVAVLLWLVLPWRGPDLSSHPRPAADYATALALADSLFGAEPSGISPECGSRLLVHGARTGRVIVMFHGLTNCPAQFDSLARMAYAGGANVLVPRLPRHGYADRMTDQLALSDAREMCECADHALDVAAGLGDSVTVVGLSVGGTLAAWAAQVRPGVDRAVLIAPMLGVARAPGRWGPVATRVLGRIPNVYVWWDDARKQNLLGPKHVYPRFATRAVSATLEVGAMTLARAARHTPAARSITMITVGGDVAVDNGTCAEIVRRWRQHGANEIGTYEFPASLALNHDVVDPEQHGGNPAVTYPVLMHYIAQ